MCVSLSLNLRFHFKFQVSLSLFGSAERSEVEPEESVNGGRIVLDTGAANVKIERELERRGYSISLDLSIANS